MELPITQIPDEFTKSIPKGLHLIKKDNHDFLLVESLFCPKGHNLIFDSVRIHGEASIKLKIRINDEDGFLFIDSFWGSHAKLFSFIPPVSKDTDTYVEAHCPYCDVSLIENYSCGHEQCNSDKSILMLLPGANNQIHVCAKLGCPGHALILNSLPLDLVNTVSNINFFGAGSDDFFGGI